MKKGITPIISIIILLLITIALAGVAYTFLMGQMFTRISGSFDIPSGGAYCTNRLITVQVVNTGSATLVSSDFILVRINGVDESAGINPALSIAPGEGGILIGSPNAYNCSGGCNTGANTVDISTQQSSIHETVYCA